MSISCEKNFGSYHRRRPHNPLPLLLGDPLRLASGQALLLCVPLGSVEFLGGLRQLAQRGLVHVPRHGALALGDLGALLLKPLDLGLEDHDVLLVGLVLDLHALSQAAMPSSGLIASMLITPTSLPLAAPLRACT